MNLGSQRQEVAGWLESLFDASQIPDYELNAKTISALYELSQKSRLSDRCTQLVVDDLQQKTDEYYAEAQRLSAVLSRLNFTQANMSQLGANCVKTLAKLGVSLDVRDVSDTCFYLALQGLDDEIESVEKERKSEAEKLNMLMEKSQPASMKYQSLQRDYDIVKSNNKKERQRMEKKTENAAFLHSKAKSYAKEVTKLQDQLSQTHFDESILHESLVKKSEHLQSLQERLSPMMAELQSYSTLPPDLAETKIKIEQKKRELKHLEKELAECIDFECHT